MTKFLSNFVFIYMFIALISSNVNAQNSGELAEDNILTNQVSYDGNIYIAIDKDELTPDRKKELQSAGVKINGAYNNGSIIISIPEGDAGTLTNETNLDFHTIDNSLKISDELSYSGETGIAITFHGELSDEAISNIKNDYGIIDSEFSVPNNQILIGNIDASLLENLAALPEVAYIAALVDEPEPLSDDAISFHHAGTISSPLGLDLKGEGMIVGLGDGGKLQDHIDMDGRVIDKANSTYSSYFDHADKMAGIIAGGGHKDERFRGYAPEATLVTAKTFRIFYYMHEYYTNDGMRLTNNSYGSSFYCSSSGQYDYYSTMLDKQMVRYHDALHIVAAGNSGGNTCNDYPQGYNTVLKTYAAAKNVLTVGGVMEDRTVNPISGRGPVMDGRIKPEIVALSQSLATTGGNNNYSAISGTSSATANVTGATTLLYERAKKNTGMNPEGVLLKAVLCNTADDAGNEGPDFQYGFGIMNIQNAIDDIDAGNYILGETTANTPNLTYNINVAEGERELKVLLTWNDLAQTVSNAPTLINDLDLSIVAPDGTVYKPWVLDHSATGVTHPAIRGLDRINNIEQITIDNPEAGEYTVMVNTFNLNSAEQKFAISHTTIQDKMNITYPVEGEVFRKNEKVLITWDANLESTTGYAIDYSSDNEVGWTNIGTADATASSIEWTVPVTDLSNVKMRVTAIGSGTTSTSGTFNITRKLANLSVTALCGSYININWNNMVGAASYEVFQMGEKDMELIATTTESEYLVEGRLEEGKEYWFTVRAILEDGRKTRRAIAKSATGVVTYPCPFENDVEITNVEGPKKGRAFTSTSLPANRTFSVDIYNSGTNDVADIPLVFNINGVETTEVVPVTIASGETYTYTSEGFDFTAVGEYNVEILADLNGDEQRELNKGEEYSVQLANEVLAMPTFEAMEDRTHFSSSVSVFAPEELPYMDFNTTNNAGTVSILDNNDTQKNVLRLINASYSDYSEAIFTRNISNEYVTYARMNYKVSIPEGATGNDNKVEFSMRASDTDDWIQIGYLEATGAFLPEQKLFNLTEFLSNHEKEFSTSTQVRFRLTGNVEMELDEMSYMSEQNVLPVELVSFEATKIEENALLKWVTASELNNDYFEVQVAKGDEEFRRGEFITLDKVEGQGTTVEETVYTYNDVSRFKSDTRYYRLKQVDFDGAFEYSEVKSVRFEVQPELDLRVYPNPFISGRNPNIYFELEYDSEVRFTLTDSAGRIVKEDYKTYSAGAHDFMLELPEDLESGIYYLSGILEGKEVVSKILKMND